MSEKTKVWVRTSVLDTIVYGRNRTCTSRSIPTAGGPSDVFDDTATQYTTYSINSALTNLSTGTRNHDGSGVIGGGGGDACKNWGWSRGYILNQNKDATTKKQQETKQGSIRGEGNEKEEEMIQVCITDQDSTHCNTEVTLPFHFTFTNGDLVMDNTYGDHLQEQYYFDDSDDDDQDDGDDYNYGGGYDDYNHGGSSSNGNHGTNDCRRGKPEDKYPNDLITLTHLHEPSVVYCLRKRYAYDKIYTSTGPILIALNPFKNCSALYNEKIMKQYWIRGEKQMTILKGASASSGNNKNEKDQSDDDDIQLPPHVYATADHSFRNMMSKLEEIKQQSVGGGRGQGRRPVASSSKSNNKSLCCNQSILVSGESGAGKTVTTKFIMQYLATLSKRSSKDGGRRKSLTASGGKTDIEQQVLQSNPILESFGNARTIRNDNSSRFGKFIEIQFTETGNLIGANIETYLLEKVRLVSQTEGERNYHIFYEILQGMEDNLLEKFYLTEYTAVDFRMTNQSDTYDRRDGVSDYETFQDLLGAMETMGFESSEQSDIMSVTCALLHASNLTLNSINAGDESEVDRSNVHLEPLTSLLGISADALNRALCYFSITAGREKHTRSNSKEKAAKGLLALIKATYGALFTYVVRRVNESITVEDVSAKGGRGKDVKKAAASIGVLDIFGFESFKSNSFEQLCINYCNETLQQQFNMFVLKNEQDEYEKEGIQWSFISFPDNQDALDLINKRGSGILSILDDQCRAPGTTDKTFINDVYQKLSRHKRFQANRRQVGSRKFAIIHYAGTVEYGSKGFVEKNRDDLPKEGTELLLSSSNSFVQKLGTIIDGPNAAANAAKSRIPSKSSKLTVGGQFSRQLQELRQKIDNTLPHYVRCLKPNDELIPDHFDPIIVADQLRCAGVIEAVRVSRVGYPQRYTHARFLARYHILGQNALKLAARSSRRRKPVDVLVQAIAHQMKELESQTNEKDGAVDLVSIGIQVGKTKVFLRRKAYESLEMLRNRRMRDGAIKIQSLGRCYMVKRDYNKSKSAVISLQCFFRRIHASRIVQERRRNLNAIKIQTYLRSFVVRRHFQAMKRFSLWLQKRHRGNMGRALYNILNSERKATILQKSWRMFFSYKRFKMKKGASMVLQCAWRCFKARKELKALRIAARDLNNTAQERDKLREENKKLQKALMDALSKNNQMDLFEKEKKQLLGKINELENTRAEKENEVKNQQQIIEDLRTKLDISDKKCAEVSSSMKNVRTEVQSKMDDELSKHKLELGQCTSKISDLEQSLCEKSNEIDKQLNVIEQLNRELVETKDQCKENKENEAKAIEEQNRVTDLEVSLERLESENSQFLHKIDNLQKACELKDKERNDLLSKLEDFSSSTQLSSSNEDNVSGIKEALDRATLAEEQIQSQNDELTVKIVSLEEACRLKEEENEKQQSIIEKLQEKLKLASQQKMNHFQALESKASEEMDKLIDNEERTSDDINPSRPSTPMFSLADESNEDKDARIATLESEISDLKTKLSETESNTMVQATSPSSKKKKSNASLQKEVDRLKKKLAETKEISAEEILTLQDEVERLNKELRTVKPHNDEAAATAALLETPSDLNSDLSTKEGSNEYDEVVPSEKHEEKFSKMIDALMAKDEEIRQLRREVTTLRDQLDETTMSMLSESHFNDDMDDRSVISRIFTRGPNHRSGGRSVAGSARSGPGMTEDKLSLRKANMELKRELDIVKEELEECRFELEEERERSGKEIKAFGDALKGVDELRHSAEAMSREIMRLRQRDDDDVPEDPFAEVPRDSYDEEGTVVRMQQSKSTIGTASLRSEQPSIWNKMKLSVRSLNEEVIPEDSAYKGGRHNRGKIARKNSGDESVFSSFF